MMNTIEQFIYSHTEKQKKIMLYLHDLIMSFPEMTGKISYKVPFYYRKSWICYLNPIKKEKVELAFPRGYELSNIQGILISKDRKMVKGVEFSKLQNIPEKELIEILNEAIILDETVPYKFK